MRAFKNVFIWSGPSSVSVTGFHVRPELGSSVGLWNITYENLNISKIKRQFCVRILIICDKRSFEMFQFLQPGKINRDLKYVKSTQARYCFQVEVFPKASGVIL